MKITRRFSKVERDDILLISQECLWGKDGEQAREYLLKTRRLTEDVVRKFKIGYLPEDLNHQLSGRVILPLFDASGSLVTITSRIIRDQLPSDILPRYWHEAYEKSWYLYGLDAAKEFMRKWRFAVVVEGQIDCIQMHAHGMKNTVALCSTNMHDMQFASILRYCEEIVTVLDNDTNMAGQKGAEKIKSRENRVVNENVLVYSSDRERYTLKNGPTASYGMPKYKIESVLLSGAKDPDEYILKMGFPSLQAQIKRAVKEIRKNNVF